MCVHSEYQIGSVIQWFEHATVHIEVQKLMHAWLKEIRSMYGEYRVMFISTKLYRDLYRYIFSIT